MSASAPSIEQMEVFFNFLEEHRDLARGLLRNVDGRVQSQRLWEEIQTTLNAMGGCTKTVQQWQRVWTDRKYIAKRNIAAARRSASATGGGPSTAPQLSRWDLRVNAIMGEGFGGPQTTARVPAFAEESLLPIIEPRPSASQPPTAPESPILELHVNEPLQPSGQRSLPVVRTPNVHNEPTQRPSNTRRRRRVRERINSDPADSVTRRFLANEERRIAQGDELNIQLAGIRAVLTDLLQLLRDRT